MPCYYRLGTNRKWTLNPNNNSNKSGFNTTLSCSRDRQAPRFGRFNDWCTRAITANPTRGRRLRHEHFGVQAAWLVFPIRNGIPQEGKDRPVFCCLHKRKTKEKWTREMVRNHRPLEELISQAPRCRDEDRVPLAWFVGGFRLLVQRKEHKWQPSSP